MKGIVIPALVLIAIFLVSCDRDDPQPVKNPVILPLRMEMDDYKREFMFDDALRVSRIKNISTLPGGVMEAVTEYFYADDGTLERAITDTGYRLEYTYQDGKISRTDEFINDQFTQYLSFSYDEKGRLHEFKTWQDIPEMGGWIAVAREVYLYDQRDNVTDHFLYYWDGSINGHKLLTAFEYGDYDNYPEAESLFNDYTFNPQAVFRKNNPGRMITRNGLGNTVSIDHYSYTYNVHGYPTRKTTTTIFSASGSSGSYETRYYYEER